MKDYFVFPDSGSTLRIEKSGEDFLIGNSLNVADTRISQSGENINITIASPQKSRFSKSLILQRLEELTNYIKKYG